MSAIPLVPGLLYQVKRGSRVQLVAATNGADAIAKCLGEVAQ